jgi:hypothetical protein
MIAKILNALAKEIVRVTAIRDGCFDKKDWDAARWHWYVEGLQRGYDLAFEVDRPRLEVQRFAMAMERKLRQNDHKGGWDQMSGDELLERLDEEVDELKKVLHPMRKRQPQLVLKEAVDVANFCMFIADNHGALKEEK